ncbi:hypothetical protein COB28_04725 [Candidatus Dependentiae bacterium]|nr:MAG: hypothetical protein COB28_04725 [Candidatus Dependentiae bacterium]
MMKRNILLLAVACVTIGNSLSAGDDAPKRNWTDTFMTTCGATNSLNAARKIDSQQNSSKKNYRTFMSTYPAVYTCDMISTVTRSALFSYLAIDAFHSIKANMNKKNKFKAFKKYFISNFSEKPVKIASALALGCHALSYYLDPTKK